MKLGILGTADIAFRRFLPALQKCEAFTYGGVATRNPEKAAHFVESFGGNVYDGYDALLEDDSIEAVYVPLPPALHFEWGKKVLESGKHLLMEKPFTTSAEDTQALLSLAEKRNLAVHENYMFLYHSQLAKIRQIISDGELGEIRLYRMAFGFPKRAEGDFRYNKALGGGALLDCGGYPIRLALELLGEDAQVVQAQLSQPEGYEVDLFGNAVLQNKQGICAQISFGMDNSYKCELEVWGSKASLSANRIFTAGADVEPELILRSSVDETQIKLPKDDQFLRSIEYFVRNVCEEVCRNTIIKNIAKQGECTQRLRRMRDENGYYWSE